MNEKDKTRAAEEEKEKFAPVVEACDKVVFFMNKAGEYFTKIADSPVSIDPVEYNGKTKKGKLENLFVRYAKSCMSLESLMGQLGAMMPPANPDNTDTGNTETEAAAASAAASAEEKMAKLDQFQMALGIKKNKREQLEQKVFFDMITKGEGLGGLGNLGELMGAMGGDGGGRTGAGAFADMMGAMGQGMGGGGGAPGAFGGSGVRDGFPGMGDFDPSKMDPKEVEGMSKQALAAVKEALLDGSITKQDILELEKMMGGDVASLSNMMKGMPKNGPGAELAELADVFKQLAEIKKRG